MSRVFYDSKLAKFLLFDGYTTIMLFGFIFTKYKKLMPSTLRHEKIHCKQYEDCLIAFLLPFILLGILHSWWWMILYPLMFYILYGIEWAISMIYNTIRMLIVDKRFHPIRANDKTYYASAFEMEAYDNEGKIDYLKTRKRFAFIKYYGKV